MATILTPFTWLAIGIIYLYRWIIRPLIGPRCRFTPSCSEYAMESLKTHGFTKGCWLSGKRLLKCHPLSEGGYDPIPPITKSRDK